MVDKYKEEAFKWIDRNSEQLIEISDTIWEYAELGLQEFKSSKLLASTLEENGFEVRMGVADMPTAFVATWGEGKPVIGIMGEYDALPGLSQKKVPWKEPLKEGAPGHGCGHNIHGTSGMGGAIAVKNAMEKYGLKGTIRFYGTPAEENFSGKVYMVRDGLFDDIDIVLSHHPSTMNAVTLKSSLAINSAKFIFYGKASHAGATPEEGRSALDAVELMNVGVNYLREHIIQDARIHYVIEKGGSQPNIVPDYARSWYYVRAPERDQVEFIYEWVTDIAKAAAMMTRTRLEIQFLEGIYNLIPNRTIGEVIVNNMRTIGPPRYTEEELEFSKAIAKTINKESKIRALQKSGRPNWETLVDKLLDDEVPDPWGEGDISHGSTDVADVSWKAPTVEFTTAAWVLGTAAHSWQSTAQSASITAHKALLFASKTLSATALDFLLNKELRRKVKKEHEKRLNGRKYRSPIPPDHKPPIDIWNK